jgi:hypothetical protein
VLLVLKRRSRHNFRVWFAISPIRAAYVPCDTTMGTMDDGSFGASSLSETMYMLQITFRHRKYVLFCVARGSVSYHPVTTSIPQSTKDSIPAHREHHPRFTRLLGYVSTLTFCKGLDPHSYTSGRWLHRDKLERDSRYIAFNFDALCRRVIELCPGAVSIAGYDKKEGGYNRVFIFTTDNTQRIVARPPFALGPARLTTNSEVATIKYCECKSKY